MSEEEDAHILDWLLTYFGVTVHCMYSVSVDSSLGLGKGPHQAPVGSRVMDFQVRAVHDGLPFGTSGSSGLD